MIRKMIFLPVVLLLCGGLLFGQVHSACALAESAVPTAALARLEASGQGLPLESTLLQVGSLAAIVNGQTYSLDAAPYINPGANRVMVPLGLLVDGAGLEWDWGEESRLITLQKDGRILYLGLGTHQALMDGEWVSLDCPCDLGPSGLPFVPLRFVVEALGGEISYDASTKVITIARWAADQDTDPEIKAAFKSAKAVARTEIWKAITAGIASSAGVAIMDQGRTVYSEGIGMADRDAGMPADSDTVFNIGSISKLFAATSIMLLVDEGKIVLDAPVTEYLPGFVMADERYQEITVRMLLNHSSGLPGSTFWGNLGSAYNEDVYQELLQVLSLSTLKHRPGELATYCNDGFTLAEMVVARVSGLDYGEFLTRRIFAPLALGHAGLGVGRLDGGETPARAYDPNGRAMPLEVVSLLGSGGISATPEDLCRFADSFSDPASLLQSASWLEMLRRQPTELQGKLRADAFPFGLGWDFADVAPFNDLRLYGKSGGTGHYSSMLYTIPSQRISVAVTACGAGSNSQAIAYEVLSAYLKEKGLVSAGEEAFLPQATAEAIPPELKAYEGCYLGSGSALRLQIDVQAGRLNMFFLDGGAGVPVFSAIYNDGLFHDDQNTYYFTTLEGSDYLVGNNFAFGYDMAVVEKLRLPADPKQLSIPMEGKLWLRRGIKPIEEPELLLPYYIVPSGLIPDLPGYVDFAGPKVVVSPDYAGMPAKAMRDLEELRLVDREGATWVWLSGADYMPAEACPQLGFGLTSVTIEPEMSDEWLRMEDDAMLSFALPPGSRALVLGEAGVLFDSHLDSGHVLAPAGSFVHLAGNPGDLLQVTAAPQPQP